MYAYLGAWAAACLVAVFIAWLNRARISLFSPAYRRFLAEPWKLSTAALSIAGITLVTPLVQEADYTWNYWNSSGMGLLAFTTAPWVVATLYAALHGQVRPSTLYVALVLWMFSVSWSYDAIHLIVHREYPPTWLANIAASSFLYLPAGLFWNLAWTPVRGAHFAFTEAGWPDTTPPTPFYRILPYALPLMVLVSAQILYFLVLAN